MALAPGYPIRTERLELRPLTDEDVDALVAYFSLAEVCRYLPLDPMDEHTLRARLASDWARRGLDDEGQMLVLGATLSGGGALIGDVSLRWHSKQHRSGEIGYVFHPGYSGRGYAVEAAHRVLHLAFDDLELHRVTARIDLRNARSVRLARRLGMRQETHLKENEWLKEEWTSELDFAILEHEWRAQHAEGCPDLVVPVLETIVPVPDLGSQELRDSEAEIYDRPIGVHLLYRHPVTGADHYLIRYPPGLVAAAHRHSSAHTFVVLEGALEVNGARIGPGSYCHFPAGTLMHHAPAGEDGCLFVAVFDGPQDVVLADADGG